MKPSKLRDSAEKVHLLNSNEQPYVILREDDVVLVYLSLDLPIFTPLGVHPERA